MLRYGIISEIKEGRARVYFDEIDITSGWLSLPNSMSEVKLFPITCQVAVEMHDNGEDGEILHRVITDDENIPEWANKTTEGYRFSDGTSIYYDTANKTLTIDGGSEVELIFKCKKLTVTGDVVAGVEEISLINHLHTTPVGPSGVPIPKP